MAFTSDEFRIETGYGQTITISVCKPGPNPLIRMEAEQIHWDQDGERITSISDVNCILDVGTAQKIAIALYQGCKAGDPEGTVPS